MLTAGSCAAAANALGSPLSSAAGSGSCSRGASLHVATRTHRAEHRSPCRRGTATPPPRPTRAARAASSARARCWPLAPRSAADLAGHRLRCRCCGTRTGWGSRSRMNCRPQVASYAVWQLLQGPDRCHGHRESQPNVRGAGGSRPSATSHHKRCQLASGCCSPGGSRLCCTGPISRQCHPPGRRCWREAACSTTLTRGMSWWRLWTAVGARWRPPTTCRQAISAHGGRCHHAARMAVAATRRACRPPNAHPRPLTMSQSLISDQPLPVTSQHFRRSLIIGCGPPAASLHCLAACCSVGTGLPSGGQTTA